MMEHRSTQAGGVPVPDYDKIIDRHNIEMLKQPGDLAVVDGDLALTRRGDLMLNSSEYSAMFRLVTWWRFNYPVMSVMFDAIFPPEAEAGQLERDLEAVFNGAAQKSPHPMVSLDYDEYHRINDAM